MGSIWAEMGLDTTKLDMGCAKASASLKALEGKNSALGQSAKMAATGIALIGAAVAVAAVKLAMDFETSLYNVAAITNASKAQMEGWSTSILDMSTKLPVSAKALGDAFYWVKSYMPKASDAEGFAILDTAAKLAVGGISDTTTAVKALAGTMNAYKGSSVALKDSSEYADVMATAVANGALTMQDLGDNTAKASSTAAIAGVSYRELMAAVVTLTQKGVPPATTFMALNQAMMAFIKPSDGAKAAAKDLGINFDLNSLRADGLFTSLMKIADACGTDTSALAEFFPNIRSLKAVLPLAGISADDFAVSMQTMGDSVGKTAQMFGTQMQDPAKKFAVALNDAKKPLIEMGMNMMPELEKALAKVVTILEGKNSTFNLFGQILKGAATAVWDFAGALKQVWPILLGFGAAFALFKISNFVSAIQLAASGTGILGKAMFNLQMGFMTGQASYVGFMGSLASIALVAAPAAIAFGLFVDQTQKQNAAAESAATGFRKMQDEQGALAASTLPLVAKLEDVRKKQSDAAKGSQEYINATQEVRDVQNQIAGNFPSLASGWDLERNAIMGNTRELRTQMLTRMGLAGIKPPTAGAPPEYQSMEVMLQQTEKTSKNYGLMSGEVTQLTKALGEAGVETVNLGYVSDAWYRSAEDGTAVTMQLFSQLKDSGAQAGPAWIEANRLMDDLKNKSVLWGGTLGFLNSQIVTSGQQWDTAVSGMVEKARAAGAATGALPQEVALSFMSAIPAFQSAGVQAFGAFLSATSQGRIGPGAAAGVAQQLFNTGTFTSTGVAAVDAALNAMAARLAAGRLKSAADEMAAGLKKAFDLSGLGLDKAETKKVNVEVSDHGTGASTVKSIAQVERTANNSHGVAAVRQTDNNTGRSVLGSLQQVARYANSSHPVMHVSVVYDKAAVPGSALHYFGTNQEAGKFAQQKFQEGLNSGGGVKGTVIYGGGSMTGGASLQANITALESAWAALSKTALPGWSKDVDVAAGRFDKMEEAIVALGAPLGEWRNMRKAYDDANIALAEYQKQMDASDIRTNQLTHSQELLNRSLTAQRETLTALNATLSEHKETLTKLSQMKMAGEGAASDASFAKQHEINRLQLEILKAQKEGRFNDAAKMAASKLRLEKEKTILDLQTTYDYEEQKRGLEKLLDPLKGQEMTYQNIIDQIRVEQTAVATVETQIKTQNEAITSKEQALKEIETQINKEKDAQWQLRVEYDACNKAVQTYSAQVDKMAANFLKHYDEMKARAEALNKTVASSPNKALAIYQAQLTGMAREHKSRYLDMIASARSLNQAVALSGGLGASNMAAGAGSTTTANHYYIFDKLVLNGVQDVPTLKTELMNARLRIATP